jgi:hypothetical protein
MRDLHGSSPGIHERGGRNARRAPLLNPMHLVFGRGHGVTEEGIFLFLIRH